MFYTIAPHWWQRSTIPWSVVSDFVYTFDGIKLVDKYGIYSHPYENNRALNIKNPEILLFEI